MVTLIVKLYKTISIKYNHEQNITILGSIAHGFLNILTADMVHDFKNTRSSKSLKSSNHPSTHIEIPLEESSSNLLNTTNPSGIMSPPPFYTKRPNKLSKVTRFKFLPKRKQYSNHTIHMEQSKSNTPVSLPNYSSVNANPTDYTLNTSPNYPLNTSSVNCEMDNPRVYSKTNYSFPPASFPTDHSEFHTTSN